MINSYKGSEAKKAASGAREILPAGGYEAEIIDAKVTHDDWGDRLVIAFDISNGDYRGFFAKDYEDNTREDKRWRGVFRLRIPTDDGSEKDGWSKNAFNNFIWAIEDSNKSYKWNWDETKLKGKKIGVVYRNKEWEYEGKSGWTTECGTVTGIEDIKSGKYPKLKDKALAHKTVAPVVNDNAFADVDESALPF